MRETERRRPAINRGLIRLLVLIRIAVLVDIARLQLLSGGADGHCVGGGVAATDSTGDLGAGVFLGRRP
jgi:hypothetical protein